MTARTNEKSTATSTITLTVRHVSTAQAYTRIHTMDWDVGLRGARRVAGAVRMRTSPEFQIPCPITGHL
jgi:hypothetical protein